MNIPETGSSYTITNSSCLIYVAQSKIIDQNRVFLTYFMVSKSGLNIYFEQTEVLLKNIQHWKKVG